MTPKFFSGHGFGSPLNERLARSSTPSIAACAPCYYEQVRRGLVIATALATVYFIVVVVDGNGNTIKRFVKPIAEHMLGVARFQDTVTVAP